MTTYVLYDVAQKPSTQSVSLTVPTTTTTVITFAKSTNNNNNINSNKIGSAHNKQQSSTDAKSIKILSNETAIKDPAATSELPPGEEKTNKKSRRPQSQNYANDADTSFEVDETVFDDDTESIDDRQFTSAATFHKTHAMSDRKTSNRRVQENGRDLDIIMKFDEMPLDTVNHRGDEHDLIRSTNFNTNNNLASNKRQSLTLNNGRRPLVARDPYRQSPVHIPDNDESDEHYFDAIDNNDEADGETYLSNYHGLHSRQRQQPAESNHIPLASHHMMPIVVAIQDDDDDAENSDSSMESSRSDSSSTPTTADVADVTVNRTIRSNNTLHHGHRHQHLRHHMTQDPQKLTNPHQSSSKLLIATSAIAIPNVANSANSNIGSNGSNNGSIADDNISGSIATTTTDVDMDSIVVASPNMTVSSINRTHLGINNRTNYINTNNNNNNGIDNMDADALTTMARYPSNSVSVMMASSQATTNLNTGVSYHNASAVYLQQSNDAITTTPSHRRTLSAASYRSTASQHPSLAGGQSVHSIDSRFYKWIRWICVHFKSSGIGEPSVYHALVVIFLEFFAWGLLTMPVISVLNQTFPDHTFLMNGLVMGIKGILSFLSAPLIGALSDIWGRKFFLLITVFFTCAPIPLMTINSWWFFAMISISGIFAVTFSVVFAYVADVTTVEERSRAYGLVSATFAASLVISPALGAALMEMYSDTLVVALATAIAVLDVFFILVAVPESLPEKMRPSSWGAPISWEQADPFAALRKVGTDHTILMQCVTVLLSYLPEAGQYSCIFVYLKLKMGFNSMEVAIFIAVVGILSISIQVTLGYLMRAFGAKRTIILGLVLEMLQLLWYGFGSQKWMMWAAGILAALGSITYPAISAFVSIHSTPDRQGAVQGMVTGMRGLCNGLGPAMFGVIFYLFNVDLNESDMNNLGSVGSVHVNDKYAKFIPGPPFVFGAFMVILAILVAIFIPEARGELPSLSRTSSEKKRISVDVQYEVETGHRSASGPLAPLMRSDSLAQL